jgi:hypothetical protein
MAQAMRAKVRVTSITPYPAEGAPRPLAPVGRLQDRLFSSVDQAPAEPTGNYSSHRT